MSRPVLLDTDLGSDVDDADRARAAARAARSCGSSPSPPSAADVRGRAWAAARLLGLGGPQRGRRVRRRARRARAPRALRVARDRDGGLPGRAPTRALSDEPAAERIVRAARETPGLELIAIGPLTNLAHALALDPEAARSASRACT